MLAPKWVSPSALDLVVLLEVATAHHLVLMMVKATGMSSVEVSVTMSAGRLASLKAS